MNSEHIVHVQSVLTEKRRTELLLKTKASSIKDAIAIAIDYYLDKGDQNES